MHKIVVDTNLLILLVVGLVDTRLVGRHKRTRKYLPEDFELLSQVVARFRSLLVTPHILTEASNLLAQTDAGHRPELMATLALLIRQSEERAVASREVVDSEAFSTLGLTDAVLVSELTEDALVLTDDLKLYLALTHRNRRTVNFTHLRAGAWDLDQI